MTTHFNYESNIQVARGKSVYDLNRTQSNSLKDQCGNAMKPEIVTGIDLSVVDGEEHHFFYFENEICFYFCFDIKCCFCQSDPAGNIDDATKKSTNFLVAMNSFSSSQKNCARHCIALTCGPSSIDFILEVVEERMQCLFLVNEQLCSFYCGKITRWMSWVSRIPRKTWSWQDGSFFEGFDSVRVDLLNTVQNKNGVSHLRIGTHYCYLPTLEQKPCITRRHQWENPRRLSKTSQRAENHQWSIRRSCWISVQWLSMTSTRILEWILVASSPSLSLISEIISQKSISIVTWIFPEWQQWSQPI